MGRLNCSLLTSHHGKASCKQERKCVVNVDGSFHATVGSGGGAFVIKNKEGVVVQAAAGNQMRHHHFHFLYVFNLNDFACFLYIQSFMDEDAVWIVET